MDEAQPLADRVAVMAAGRLVAIGTPAELGGRDALPTEIRFALPAGVGLADLPELAGAEVTERRRPRAESSPPTASRAAHRLTGWALERGLALRGFAVASRPSRTSTFADRRRRPRR